MHGRTAEERPVLRNKRSKDMRRTLHKKSDGIMKHLFLLGTVLLFCATGNGVCAQDGGSHKPGKPARSWVKMARELDDDFFRTPEAVRIAGNVLLYQQTTGGWPKNMDMAAPLSAQERERLAEAKQDTGLSTIDNDATTTEIRFLARAYGGTGNETYRDAALRGIGYLLEAQYPNGGWPQFYPRDKGYYTHITYNDNAMVNVMLLLREVYERQEPYSFVPDSLCRAARRAFDRGIRCILGTQVARGDTLTVWCAQHDEHTLLPAKARAYELPSLSGAESCGIVMLLMSLPRPSAEVVKAVEAAVAWFRGSRIEGLRREYFTDSEGRRDYRMVPCTGDGDGKCPALWARFYTLEDNRPFFCDRDGIVRFDLSEIGHERRNGYSWYNSLGLKVLERYEEWKEELSITVHPPQQEVHPEIGD